MTGFGIFGLILLSWLTVGFLVGVKSVFVEQSHNKENLEKFKEELIKNNKDIHDNPAFEMVWSIFSKKSTFLALSALLGFIALFFDISGKSKKLKKYISAKRGK